MIVRIAQLVKTASEQGYALGAFNIENLETTLGVIRAAVAQRSPVILQISERSIQYAGLKALTNIVEVLGADEAGDIPVALHLDHGKSFRSVAECIRIGFSSIMIDNSELPFAENLILTKQAADYAHRHDVWAQGELGEVKGLEEISPEERKALMTDPGEAKDFVEKTGVDTLAVAIGNIHGVVKLQKNYPELDLDRLAAIHKKLPNVPLVLHGASGLSGRQLAEATELGVRIVNFNTELKLAFVNSLRTTLERNREEFDPREVMRPAILALQKTVEKNIGLVGSSHRA